MKTILITLGACIGAPVAITTLIYLFYSYRWIGETVLNLARNGGDSSMFAGACISLAIMIFCGGKIAEEPSSSTSEGGTNPTSHE